MMHNSDVLKSDVIGPNKKLASIDEISASEILSVSETRENNNEHMTENDKEVINNRKNQYPDRYEKNMIPGEETIHFHEDSISFNGTNYMRNPLDSGNIDNKNIALGKNGENMYTFAAAKEEAEKVGLKVPCMEDMINILNCLPPLSQIMNQKESYRDYNVQYEDIMKPKLDNLNELLGFKGGNTGNYKPGLDIIRTGGSDPASQTVKVFWTSNNDTTTQEQIAYIIPYHEDGDLHSGGFTSMGIDYKKNTTSDESSYLRTLPVHCIRPILP